MTIPHSATWHWRIAATGCALLLAACHRPAIRAATTTPDLDAEFDAAVAELLPRYWRLFPTEATAAGVHDHDGELEDLSAAGIARARALFAGTLARIEPLAPDALSLERRVDREILLGWLRWRLLDLDRLQSWKTSPGLYVDLASNAVFNLFVRESAPAMDRARAVQARLGKMPRLFDAARANLDDGVSRLAVETAIRDAQGAVAFFDGGVRDFLGAAMQGDAALTQALEDEDAAASAVKSFLAFLEKDLLPRARGSYALGRELFVLKSKHANGVDLSPEEIAARGAAEVERLRAEMAGVASQLLPGGSVADAIARAGRDHPTAERLIAAYRERQDELRAFVVDRKLATIPGQDKLVLMETPEFARSMISAAVFTAGAFETVDPTTYYVVTPVEATLPKPEQEAQLVVDHALGLIDVVSIHEAYPGHHVAHLHALAVPSPTRKLVSHWVFDEGWAHYAEQMVVDAGYHAGPAIRIFQQKDALLRACRMVVDPKIALGEMTWEDARAYFESRCHQGAVTAEMEARRAALNPATVYTYTLGKLWIQALAEKERKRLSASFALGEFHDRLLAHGSVPLPLLAKAYFGVTLGVP